MSAVATGRRRADAWAALLALAAIVAWEWAGFDLPLSRPFAHAGGFDARSAWWARTLLHEGGRVLGGLTLALLVAACVKTPPSGLPRAERARAVAVILVCLLAVPMLKRFTQTSCPWDLAEFGGTARYVPHWVRGVGDSGPGHCFPSGHAVAAFAFLPMYFAWRARDAARARLWLGGVMVAGTVFGFAQLARGAHFASHTMWSAWLCWVISALADALFRLRAAPATAGAPAAVLPRPVPVAARPGRRVAGRRSAGR